MVRSVNIAEAKAKLSELITAAMAGEEVMIARAGHPLVKLTPVSECQPQRQFGMYKNIMTGAADLDWLAPLSPVEQAALEGAQTDILGITLPSQKL